MSDTRDLRLVGNIDGILLQEAREIRRRDRSSCLTVARCPAYLPKKQASKALMTVLSTILILVFVLLAVSHLVIAYFRMVLLADPGCDDGVDR